MPDQPAVGNMADPDATVTALVQRADDHPAMSVPHGETLTYEQLHTSVVQLGRELRGAGVVAGDTVALSLGNGPDMVACFLAILAMRASAAPLNPAYTASEARSYLDDLRPRALVIQPGVGLGAAEACSALKVPVHELAATGHAERPFTLGLEMAAGAVEHPQPDDVALLLHTSGTTSTTEGRAASPREPRLIDARDHRLLPARACRCQSLRHAPVPCPRPPGLDACAPGLRRHRARCTAVQRELVLGGHAEPSSHLVFGGSHHSSGPEPARRAGAAPRHALRFARSSSAALSPTLQARRRGAAFRCRCFEAYGMTEAAHQMATNPLPPAERRPGSVGRATGVELALFDEDWNRPDGATGEVASAVARSSSGYRDNPEATAACFATAGSGPGISAMSRPTDTCPAGADQGAHQPRRREDLAVRGRGGAALPSRGRHRGCRLRRAG